MGFARQTLNTKGTNYYKPTLIMFIILNFKSDVHYREVSLFIAIHIFKIVNIFGGS